jgi:hypothetical protein
MAKKDGPLLRTVGAVDPAERERVKAEVDQAIAWLESKWAKGEDGAATRCPYCHHNSWSVGPPLELVTRRSAMAPSFPVVCDTCGHTTFVSAIVAGLAQEPSGES